MKVLIKFEHGINEHLDEKGKVCKDIADAVQSLHRIKQNSVMLEVPTIKEVLPAFKAYCKRMSLHVWHVKNPKAKMEWYMPECGGPF